MSDTDTVSKDGTDGLETVMRVTGEPASLILPIDTELVTRSQAEDIIRDLETKILEVAISDRLDDAGSPLTWQERAEKAEAANDELEREVTILRKSFFEEKEARIADNAAKDARIKELDRCHEGTIDLCNQKTAQIEALETQLAAAKKVFEFFTDASFDDALVKYQEFQDRGAKARAVLGGKP